MSGGGSAAAARSGEEVVRAVRALPGGEEIAQLADARPDTALIGGSTRDLLLGRTPRELDLVVGGEVADFARALAQRLDRANAEVTLHERFQTAVVDWPQGRVDIAARRAERYPAPGALPETRAGSTEEDLRRRDFTVNAIAVPLAGPQRGRLLAAPNALEDLAAERLRVLHERSFIDDPTRLLRLARYRARLRFEPEQRTAQLARQALAGGALETVSRARVGAELRLALGESDPVATLSALDELGVLAALDSQLRFDERLARRALALAPADARRDLLALAALLVSLARGKRHDAPAAMFKLLDELEFPAVDRERARSGALLAPTLLEVLRSCGRPSQLRAALASAPVEAVALAGALTNEGADGAAATAAEWLRSWRHVRLSITGDDLLAAGIPAGTEIGRRLAAALARKLDGEIADSRQAELRAALEA